MTADERLCKQAGMDYFLIKPLRLDVLVKLLVKAGISEPVSEKLEKTG